MPHQNSLMFTIFIYSVMAEETLSSSTDLEEINTEDELATDISTWSDKERKKLQHMTEFHQEYQRVFGNKASLHTIIRKRLSHMNPPIPSSLCKEERQDAESNEVIVEFITDSKGNRVKRLKPLFIKSEPNKTYIQHIPSDDDLPPVPEEKFSQNMRLQLIPIVSLYHQMMKQVMTEQLQQIVIVQRHKTLRISHIK